LKQLQIWEWKYFAVFFLYLFVVVLSALDGLFWKQ
jgi:hypothetical protein